MIRDEVQVTTSLLTNLRKGSGLTVSEKQLNAALNFQSLQGEIGSTLLPAEKYLDRIMVTVTTEQDVVELTPEQRQFLTMVMTKW